MMMLTKHLLAIVVMFPSLLVASGVTNNGRHHAVRKLLQDAMQERSKQAKARQIFVMALTARDSIRLDEVKTHAATLIAPVSRRYLQVNATNVTMPPDSSLPPLLCPIESVLTGSCTLDEYCTELDADDNSTTYCTGDVNGVRDIVTTFPEVCLYFSENSETPEPFDETRFVALTDVCFFVAALVTFFTSEPSLYELSYVFTRPSLFQGTFSEHYSFTACDDVYEDQILPGYCETCTSANSDGRNCTSCAACDTPGSRVLDCSNVFPELVTDCDNEAAHIIGPVVGFFKGICPFEKVVAGECEIQEYCDFLKGGDDSGIESMVCEGDVTGEWTLSMNMVEVCNDEPENLNVTSQVGSFCGKEKILLMFRGDTPTQEDYSYVVTRPVESAGSLRVLSDLASCDPDSSNVLGYFWGDSVCAAACGDLEVNDEACTSGCETCPDGESAFSCTNVDESLVKPCDGSGDRVPVEFLTYILSLSSADMTSAGKMLHQAMMTVGVGIVVALMA